MKYNSCPCIPDKNKYVIMCGACVPRLLPLQGPLSFQALPRLERGAECGCACTSACTGAPASGTMCPPASQRHRSRWHRSRWHRFRWHRSTGGRQQCSSHGACSLAEGEDALVLGNLMSMALHIESCCAVGPPADLALVPGALQAGQGIASGGSLRSGTSSLQSTPNHTPVKQTGA